MAVASAEWTNVGQQMNVDLWDPATRSGVATTYYMNTGSGTVAANVTDTALGSENAEARVVCTITQPTSETLRFSGTVTFTGNRVCEEAAVFDAASGGNCVGRITYPQVNSETDDEMTFDVDLPFRSGSE